MGRHARRAAHGITHRVGATSTFAFGGCCHSSGWTNSTSALNKNWFDMPCPFKGGPVYGLSFAQGKRTRSELYIDSSDAGRAAALYDALLARRAVIDATAGGGLVWQELPDRRASRIAFYGDGDVTHHAEHERIVDWMIDTQERLRSAIDGVADEVRAEIDW